MFDRWCATSRRCRQYMTRSPAGMQSGATQQALAHLTCAVQLPVLPIDIMLLCNVVLTKSLGYNFRHSENNVTLFWQRITQRVLLEENTLQSIVALTELYIMYTETYLSTADGLNRLRQKAIWGACGARSEVQISNNGKSHVNTPTMLSM